MFVQVIRTLMQGSPLPLATATGNMPLPPRPAEATAMSAAAFDRRLTELRLAPAAFAVLFGTRLGRVMAWLDDREAVPHAAALLASTLGLPGALPAARAAALRRTGVPPARSSMATRDEPVGTPARPRRW